MWTLLQGKALEVVEHLTPEQYQIDGGEKVLFNLLDKRWPEIDKPAELGENINKVFTIRANEGETLREWCARASECFDGCNRKSGVQFPEEAKGWILLNCGGLTAEQRAVVLARAQGNLKLDDISQSMRSCFPDYVVPKRRVAAVNIVEEDFKEGHHANPGDPISGGFDDVEVFLSEFGLNPGEDEDPNEVAFEEGEVAEVLASTWKEKRQELNKLQKGRKFEQASDVRRSFRVQVEELKRRTRCRKCGKIGHWQKECRSQGTAAASSSSATGSHAGSQRTGAGVVENVEHFICVASPVVSGSGTMVAQLLEKRRQVDADYTEVCLVSSPGFAVLDSGCGKTIIGSETLVGFKKILSAKGIVVPPEFSESNTFKYGNGETEVSNRMVKLPICLAGRRGSIHAAVVKGQAPLLMSRVALKSLEAEMNFGKDQLIVFTDRVSVPLTVNSAGQYTVNVSNFAKMSEPTVNDDAENDLPDPPEPSPAETTPCDSISISKPKGGKRKDYWEFRPADRVVVRHHLRHRRSKFSPSLAQCPVPIEQLTANRVTQILDASGEVQQFCDQWTHGSHAHETMFTQPWVGSTVFQLHDDAVLPPGLSHANEALLSQWTNKQHRHLMSQLSTEVLAVDSPGKDGYDVVEVFSPPRFALEGTKRGLRCLSADLCTQWDFRRASDRKRMNEIVQQGVGLLVLCPPCTWAGGWFHLNKHYMDPKEVSEKEVLTKLFVQFCCSLVEEQLKRGGRVMFEHPKGSTVWDFPCMQALMRKLWTLDLHMCCYGMKVPQGDLIRKSTRLLVSHQNMLTLSRKCPGDANPKHRQHQVIAGSHPSVGLISKFAGQYPQAFVKAVLNTEPKFRSTPVLTVHNETSAECLAASRVQDLDVENEQQLKASLRKLHANLGHPSNNHLVRILKHGGASDTAIKAAREFSCDLCRANTKPKISLPAQVHRVSDFNTLVGLDIKYLPGWKVNQRVPALNIVDYASSFQLMVPLPAQETSDVIRQVFQERWVSWAGVPREVIVDPARTNVGDALTVPLELAGTTIRITAADAHWQLGKTEVHGGWFSRVLEKVLLDMSPKDHSEWMECVHAAHCKNQLIQVYGMTPSQFVFGQNPRVPENLLDEPVEVVPATASLYSDRIARQVAIRQSARKSLIELQDNRALRLALAARPRTITTYQPGTYVAYWRSQKWNKGVLENKGRWHGPAVVLGAVGRNVVIVHKRQILRCAPEQVRPSTPDEMQLVDTPQMELLGIKHLIERGMLDSRQYIDLVPEEYPSTSGDAPEPLPPSESSQAARESQGSQSQPAPEGILDDVDVPPSAPVVDAEMPEATADENVRVVPPTGSESESHAAPGDGTSSYGPLRRKVLGKSGPQALFRPSKMREDDFAEIMREIVPNLIEQTLASESSQPAQLPETERSSRVKRSLSPSEVSPLVNPKSQRLDEPDHALCVQEQSNEGVTFACVEVEVLSVAVMSQHANLPSDKLEDHEQAELRDLVDAGAAYEQLVASYLQKKASKEIKGTGNEVDLQRKIDEAKLLEWNTILSKNAARLVLGPEALDVRSKLAHRIMGSRYVITVKQEDDAPARIKARWCLQGHLDPDLHAKAQHGDLQSPTISQIGRNLLFQLIASHKWSLKLGDIRGAFLSAGQLPKQYRPLYASLPAGGIPGVQMTP